MDPVSRTNRKAMSPTNSSNDEIVVEIKKFDTKIYTARLGSFKNDMEKIANHKLSALRRFSINSLNLLRDYNSYCDAKSFRPNNNDFNRLFSIVSQKNFMQTRSDGKWIIQELLLIKDAKNDDDVAKCYREINMREQFIKGGKKIFSTKRFVYLLRRGPTDPETLLALTQGEKIAEEIKKGNIDALARASNPTTNSAAVKLDTASSNSCPSDEFSRYSDDSSITSHIGEVITTCEGNDLEEAILDLDIVLSDSPVRESVGNEGDNDRFSSRSTNNLDNSSPDQKSTEIDPTIFPAKLSDFLKDPNEPSSAKLPLASRSVVFANTKDDDVLEENIESKKSKQSSNNNALEFPDLLAPTKTSLKDSSNQDTNLEDMSKPEQKSPSISARASERGVGGTAALVLEEATIKQKEDHSTKEPNISLAENINSFSARKKLVNSMEPGVEAISKEYEGKVELIKIGEGVDLCNDSDGGDVINNNWGEIIQATPGSRNNDEVTKNKVLNDKKKRIADDLRNCQADITNELSGLNYLNPDISHSLKGLIENLKCRIEEVKHIEDLNENASETDRAVRDLQLLTLRASESLAREHYRRIIHEDYEPTEKTKNFFKAGGKVKPLTLDTLLDQTTALPEASQMRVKTLEQKVKEFAEASEKQSLIAKSLLLISEKEKDIRKELTNEINSIYMEIESSKKLVDHIKNKLDEVEGGPAMREINLFERFGTGFVLNIFNKYPEVKKEFTTSRARLKEQQENLKILIDEIGSIEPQSNNDNEDLDLQDLMHKKNELIISLGKINKDYRMLESETNKVKNLFEQPIS